MAAAPVSAPPRRQIRDEFPIFRHAIYLNSCSLGALSTRSRARVGEYLDLWERRGASAWYDVWWAALGELRERYARAVGAAAADVALHPNISSSLTAVAEALGYRSRPKVSSRAWTFQPSPTSGWRRLA